MYKGYIQKEKRRLYLKEWRKKNRVRLREKYREYFRNYNQVKNPQKVPDNRCLRGRKFEKIALSVLVGSKDCNSDNFHSPWDIEWNGLRIDVKSRKPSKGGGYSFFIRRETYDYILAVCLDKKERVLKVFLIPHSILRRSFYISPLDDKYKKYEIEINNLLGR